MLQIVATPIGNLGDISARALDALRGADAIACEDTRRTRALLSHFRIPRPAVLLSYREHREESAGARILELLAANRRVALCTDSGTPALSDPGYRLIRSAIEQGHPIEVVPGPSAVHVALLVSGLPTSSYTFKGYPPRKPGARRRFFAEERARPHTLVLFESPRRLAATLAAAQEALGDRQAAVCVELTKRYERVCRGWLSTLREQVAGRPPRGEVTLVIAGNHPKFCAPAPGAAPDSAVENPARGA